MPSLSAYLSTHYLTADPNPSTSNPKKRKRKDKPSGGLNITDDDISGFGTAGNDAGEGDDAPLMMGMESGAGFGGGKVDREIGGMFKKKKASAWTAVSSSANEAPSRDAVEDAETGEEAPQVVTTNERSPSAEAETSTTAKSSHRKSKRHTKPPATSEATPDTSADTAQQTIYRDASGRIINIAMARAEARNAALLAEQQALEKKSAQLGAVQRAQATQRAEELSAAKLAPVARYADDEELNAKQRDAARWNDPAAGFLTKKGAEKKSVTGRPLYKGGWAPNRYGIAPGHRWDGVDRGNGHEGRRFKAENARRDRARLEVEWEMDV